MRTSLPPTFLLGGAGIYSRLVLAAWSVLVARSLGVADYGEFATALALLLLAQGLADLGSTTHLARQAGAELGESRRAVVIAQSVYGLVPAVLGAVLVWLQTGDSVTAVAVAAAAITNGQLAIVRGYLRRNGRFAVEAWLQCLGATAVLVLHAALQSKTGAVGVRSEIVLYLTAQVITLLLGLRYSRRDAGFGAPLFRWPEVRDVWRRTLSLNVMGAASIVYLRADIIFVELLLGGEAAGAYAAAGQVFLASWIFATAASGPLLLRFALALRTPHRETVEKALGRSVLWLTAAAAVISVILLLLAEQVILMAYGKDFSSSVAILRVLAIALIPVYAATVAGQALLAMGQDRIVLINAVGLSVASLVLYPCSAVFGGTSGVAASMVLLQSASAVYQFRSVVRSL